MTSGNILTRAHPLKTATALIAFSLLGSCATTKTPPPIADQGSIGDADAPQVVYRNKGPYKDPLVTTQHSEPQTQSQATPRHTANMNEAQAEPAPARQNISANRGGLFTAQAQPAVQTEGNNSIVPSRMPSRSIQATVASVYSLQTPLEQDASIQPTEPAPVMPIEQQSRRPTKAEILAGLAPDPSKRQNMQKIRESDASGQSITTQTAPAQNAPAMATQLTAAETAQLQASIPTATPASANSTAASQMEQIQGAPEAKGMTRDSFIKKFLAKLRK
ncbi:hypothetical protein FB480_101916 [Agrobacterium vitis]|nr:hypothetical protein FB480_101916 [Agrobacterium vitis]